jgi:plasmid stabilization system protein ParE
MKLRIVTWTERAEASLHELADRIASDNPVAAERWAGNMIERASRLASMPMRGRVVPELGLGDMRELIVGAYRLMYRVAPDRVVVELVIEGHQLLPDSVA